MTPRQLVSEHGQQLLTLISRLIPNAEDAEEVLQDALLRALRSLDSYDASRASLHTWLSRIAYNTALNHLRLHRQPQMVSLDEMTNREIHDSELDEAFSTGDSRRVDSLRQALQMLSTDDRNLLTLRYVEDHSVAELAYILDTNAAALSSRLYRLRKKLYNLIQRIEDNEHP